MGFAEALAAGRLVLDGGLATQLEAGGADLSGELWSARLLRDDPAAIVAAHAAYLEAGAQVLTTASYQATLPGFARAGIPAPEAAELLRRSVTLAREAARGEAREAARGEAWVAASAGPYGAMLADGSEYRGNYGLSVRELAAFHRPRLEILAEAGPDVLALETVPDTREAEALLTALDGVGVPAWLSFTIDGSRTRAGQPLEDAFALTRGVDAIVAVGVNCCTPADAAAAVPMAREASGGKPVVVYPNSGETWDAAARAWTGPAGAVRVPDGAALVGGCCRVGPAAIAAIARAIGAEPR
ncbi:homocysteine S-methyltransferase [Catenuloplanes nepalensis]|uniref:Homocysteine S-methyltransferase n=1 Tax=Catenuloplanes nepalensis TaxID=587533 RepID=A0ABT9MWC8_9ACTN|nr:homocysteine S-methyltransferase [Catenuloplanes nepalensis]MDP9795743.1 homocysteine S-methyltransferase [Catenuloplanes nepalensis]